MTLAPVQATQASQLHIPKTGDDKMVDMGTCAIDCPLV